MKNRRLNLPDKLLPGLLILLLSSIVIVSCGEESLYPGGSGLIEATEVVVSAQSAGQLLKLNFDEGDRIEIADTIGMIDTLTVSLQLRQARATRAAAETRLNNSNIAIEQAELNLKLADKEFNRAQSLIKTGSIDRQKYDQIENAHGQADLALKQAKVAREAARADINQVSATIALLEKQLHDCFPTAPIPGVISDTYIEVGELAPLGKALVKIARIDTVTVKVYLPPSDLTKIKLGQTAEVDPEDGRDTPLTGTVSWISAEAEFTPKNVQTREARADLVYAVKITIPNEDEILKVGMPVMVNIK